MPSWSKKYRFCFVWHHCSGSNQTTHCVKDVHLASKVKLTQKHLSGQQWAAPLVKKKKTWSFKLMRKFLAPVKRLPQELWSQSLFEVVWWRWVQSGTQRLLPAPLRLKPLIQIWLLWLVQQNKMVTVNKLRTPAFKTVDPNHWVIPFHE